MQAALWFRLCEQAGEGVNCGKDGLLVGGVPLLERGRNNSTTWQPRQLWAEATEYCLDLWADGLLGKGDHRGMGKTPYECIMGQVSQDCGGNRVDT